MSAFGVTGSGTEAVAAVIAEDAAVKAVYKV